MSTLKNPVLAKILDSPWVTKHTQKVLTYYQHPLHIPKRYALYSISLERFILFDGLDLWVMEHAAKLLSSKMALIICIFSSSEPLFVVEDCLTWSLVDKARGLPKKQTPEVHIIQNHSEIIQEGLPIDFLDRLDGVVRDQEFMHLVLRATYAMRLTDLFWNSHAILNNENQSFYTNFYLNEVNELNLQTAEDKTIWRKGFSSAIGGIFYKAQAIDEALEALSHLYKGENFDSPASIYEQFYLKNYKKHFLCEQLYLATFFEFFGWKPQPC